MSLNDWVLNENSRDSFRIKVKKSERNKWIIEVLLARSNLRILFFYFELLFPRWVFRKLLCTLGRNVDKFRRVRIVKRSRCGLKCLSLVLCCVWVRIMTWRLEFQKCSVSRFKSQDSASNCSVFECFFLCLREPKLWA